MFPHTVTVFNCNEDKNGLIINKCIANDVFFYSEKIISQESKGEKYSNSYNCIFSNVALKKYLKPNDYNNSSDKFTLVENKTIVAKGEVTIKSLEDLNNLDNWFYVKAIVDDSDYGDEELRNIEVTN